MKALILGTIAASLAIGFAINANANCVVRKVCDDFPYCRLVKICDNPTYYQPTYPQSYVQQPRYYAQQPQSFYQAQPQGPGYQIPDFHPTLP